MISKKNFVPKGIKITAAIIEISIMFCILLYLAVRAYTKYKVAETKKNWNKHRSNPAILPFAPLAGKSFSETFRGLISNKVKFVFKPFLSIFEYIFKIFNRIFKYFMKGINKIRNLTKPIRMFFKKIAIAFYKKLSKFNLAIAYSVHKMRNSLKRSVSGFNMMFHTLHHIQFAFLSIYNSPLIPIAEKIEPVIKFISKTFKHVGFCFSGSTLIYTSRGTIPISDIKPGDNLLGDNCVISTQKFINNNQMYQYKNIIVSGSHMVYESKWIRVEDSAHAKKINYDENFIYCLSTTKGIININNFVFKDFSESVDIELNNTINQIILKKLNNLSHNKISATKLIEHGLDEDTMVENKKIKDLEIGEIINNKVVLAIIKLDSNYLNMYKYKDKHIISGNVKVNENDLWICAKDSIYSKPIQNYSKPYLYHVITTSHKIMINSCQEICDYLEIHDKNTNDEIDTIVSKYYNYD